MAGGAPRSNARRNAVSVAAIIATRTSPCNRIGSHVNPGRLLNCNHRDICFALFVKIINARDFVSGKLHRVYAIYRDKLFNWKTVEKFLTDSQRYMRLLQFWKFCYVISVDVVQFIVFLSPRNDRSIYLWLSNINSKCGC